MDDSRVSLREHDSAFPIETSDVDIHRGLAEAELTFRRHGLPAFSLGHDRRYLTKVKRVAFGVNLAVSAAFIVFLVLVLTSDPTSFLAHNPLLRSLIPSTLGVLVLLVGAYSRWLEVDPRKKRSSRVFPRRINWSSTGRLVLAISAVTLIVIALMPLRPWVRTAAAGAVLGLLAATAAVALGGVVAVLFHVVGSLTADLVPSIRSAFKETPLLIPALLLIFVTDDAWRLFGQLSNWRFALLHIVLLLTSLVVMQFVLKTERDRLYAKAVHGDPDSAKPADFLPLVLQERCCHEDLTRWEKSNLYVALMVSAALRLLLIGVATTVAMLLLGLILVDQSATASLLERSPEKVWIQQDVWGIEVYVTEYLFKLSLILGSFAALYFAVTASQPGARVEGEPLPFIKEGVHAVEQAAAVRPYYLAAHDLQFPRGANTDSSPVMPTGRS